MMKSCAIAASMACVMLSPEALACEPLEPVPFLQRVDAAERALLDDAVERHRTEVDALLDDLPCATFELDAKALGRLLLHGALARQQAGQPWTAFMATAVRIDPGMDRLVGVGHPLDRWLPAPVAANAPTYEVPEGARVLLDGQPRPRYFTLSPDAVHLVQHWQDGQLQSRWIGEGDGLAGSGPAWRFVSDGERQLRRKKARRWFAVAGGGLAAVALGTATVAWRENHRIATGLEADQLTHRSRRDTAAVVATSAAVTSALVVGVGWSVQW